MVKVRLHGTPKEIKEIADYLEASLSVHVLSRSEGYPDRGKSVYERVYLDVEYKPAVDEIFKQLKNGSK